MTVANDTNQLFAYLRTSSDTSQNRKQQALIDGVYVSFSRGSSELQRRALLVELILIIAVLNNEYIVLNVHNDLIDFYVLVAYVVLIDENNTVHLLSKEEKQAYIHEGKQTNMRSKKKNRGQIRYSEKNK